MQILVIVANIQAKTLKAEVEKGSMSPEFKRGLAGPKLRGITVTGYSFTRAKGNGVNIPSQSNFE